MRVEEGMMNDLLPDLCDVYEKEVQLLSMVMNDYGSRQPFWGQIVTLRCFEDNSLVRDILSEDGQGKVLFIDGHGSCQRALLGDQLALLAVKNGWQGIIVNGAVRDVSILATLALGIKALAPCPMKTEKRQTGERGVTLNIAETMIYPGDYIYADLNGVLLSKERLNIDRLEIKS